MKKVFFLSFLLFITAEQLPAQCKEVNCYNDGSKIRYCSICRDGELYKFVRVKTRDYTFNEQTPTLNGSGYDPDMPLSIVRGN